MNARLLRLAYSAPSEVASTPKASTIRLALEGGRAPVGVRGRVRDPELLRDALMTVAALRESDLRYKGRDRSAYLAYLAKKGAKATAAVWAAQKAFLDGAYQDDTPRLRGLDPVFTVDPDELSLEVFSRDESAYARLALSNDLIEEREAAHGTTLADLSQPFLEQTERIRTYQPLQLEADSRLAGVAASREIELRDEWLRGFLQVQSAATLPATTLELSPVDLYNLLFALRTRRAKHSPRALRFELIPGARPRIVLEPWEISLEAHGATFQGRAPRILRTFGRQRLLSLVRALPHLRKVRIHLTGSGLPSFWVLDLGLARITVALTSWAESKWGGATSFDALMPRGGATEQVDQVCDLLRKQGPASLTDLAAAQRSTTGEVRALLQRACLRGQVLFDLDRQVYRPRALLAEPVDESAIRYGSPREAAAHRLLGDGAQPTGDVRVTKVHRLVGEGEEISGEINDRHSRRNYSPRFTLDLEGQVKEAWCNCPTYQRSGLREGPCEHMIALQLFHRRELQEAERSRQTPEGRQLIRAETRTLLQRLPNGGLVSVRVALDDRAVRVERAEAEPGSPLAAPRHQRWWYDDDRGARQAYFERLEQLASAGFVDLDAMSA